MAVRVVDSIVLHHSGCENSFETIKADHIRRGWGDVFYHYVVDRLGEVHKGRPVERVASRRRPTALEVMVVGRLHRRAIFPQQDASLLALLDSLLDAHNITSISGHRDHSATLCPGSINAIKYEAEAFERRARRLTVSAQDWRDEIMARGVQNGLITEGAHKARETAEKWFVIAVVNNLARNLKK